MKRRLFNLFAGLSLLICLSTVSLWIRSWHMDDVATFGFERPAQRTTWKVEADACVGYIYINLEHVAWRREAIDFWDDREKPGWELKHLPAKSPDVRWYVPYNGTGPTFVRFFDYANEHSMVDRIHLWHFSASCWFLTAFFALLPLVVLIRFALQRSRRGTGFCPHCGYDLRATPGHCPECGTVSKRIESAV